MELTRSAFAFRYGVFDLDGTLVDTMPACGRIFAELAASYGCDPDEARSFYFATTGSPVREQFREIIRRTGRSPAPEELACLWVEFGRRFDKEPTVFFDGAADLLHELRAAGTVLFVSSASPDNTVRRRLTDGGVLDLFELPLGSTAIHKGRGHHDEFAARVGARHADDFAKDAFLCGDGETDMRIAASVGAFAIGVMGTVDGTRLLAAGANRVVPSVASLLKDPRH